VYHSRKARALTIIFIGYLSFCLGPGSLQVRNAREGPQIQVNRKVGRFVADVFLEYGKKCRLELLEGKIFAEANLS
jgi:hypothetical protein